MNDAILGVIVGGGIASVSPLLTLIVSQSRWKIEKKLELLQGRRNDLMQRSNELLLRVKKDMERGSIDSEVYIDVITYFPKHVHDTFMEWVQDPEVHDPDHSERNLKFHYYKIALAMKQSVTDVDKEIEKLLNLNKQ